MIKITDFGKRRTAKQNIVLSPTFPSTYDKILYFLFIWNFLKKIESFIVVLGIDHNTFGIFLLFLCVAAMFSFRTQKRKVNSNM